MKTKSNLKLLLKKCMFTEAPSPPLDPAEVLCKFHGFLVLPQNEMVSLISKHWGTLVLIKGIAPSFFNIFTKIPSSLLGSYKLLAHPAVLSLPLYYIWSFIEIGRPNNSPNYD